MNFEVVKAISLDMLKKWKSLLVLAIAILLTYMLASYLVIGKQTKNVYWITDQEFINQVDDYNVGIVFGGGVEDDGPLPLLRDRLDTGKELLDAGIVDKLILSGDNRQLDYNEPAVMYSYLISQGVSHDALQPDYAGRSTYETCERAKRVFSVHDAILVTESTHLPRALYLCDYFGINVIGVRSDGEASSGLKIGQRWREILARSKAVFNVYLIGEDTVLGDKISL